MCSKYTAGLTPGTFVELVNIICPKIFSTLTCLQQRLMNRRARLPLPGERSRKSRRHPSSSHPARNRKRILTNRKQAAEILASLARDPKKKWQTLMSGLCAERSCSGPVY
ncbi:hypothetical protein PoB_007402800 [Plakobranchus ocellatus]|uniref:Uncharacterized protein n=1 Tax=Plakobranchus ocellatus TaxID=259542 RepID=A0AAV4DT97_9GAST|nr:hypothetical protein PoB_007402800 [Plakobranchus ocellatus]